MTEFFSSLGAAVLPGLWMVLSLVGFAKLDRCRRRRLLRCPESGTVVFVEVASDANGVFAVAGCQNWPERLDCGGGCLKRCRPSWGRGVFDLFSLRPF